MNAEHKSGETIVQELASAQRKIDSLDEAGGEQVQQVLQEARDQLHQAEEQLHELDRLKTKFIRDISHELRTPVAIIGLYLDLLERGKPDKRDQYMEVIRRHQARLAQVVEEILNLSRLNVVKHLVAFAPVQLNTVVETVVAAFQEQFDEKGLQLDYRPAPELPPIMGSEDELVEAVRNLLSNALAYSDEGHVLVRTSYSAGEKQVGLMVEDTGIGIAEDDLPHIFEQFYRGQAVSSSNIPGSGLGLTVVKEIVELHKGTISLFSEQGAGTKVHLWFPDHKSF